jgi:cysteinyl-tRNA synthetase
MVEVKLFDSLTRELRPLDARDGQRLRFYVCGPTVYGPAHIGNFITFVRFDVLYRLLRVAGHAPYYVRNITDVDDKTIRTSIAEGLSLRAFTEKWTEKFHADCSALKLLPPDVEPRATDHIAEQIKLVEDLIAKGHAYVGGDGSVYYKVGSFEGYGKLSHFDPEELQTQTSNSAGTTNQADEYDREAVADFALWKAHKAEDGDNAWDSPWGRGRPGWHLECSAMSLKYLGSGFDLHGGGEDLCFPHHENEIAQSEAATGETFCHHWSHSVHLLVEGKKMSKSLGNFFTLDDLLAKGYSALEIRLAMLGGHYRQQFNFTLDAIGAARSALEKLEKGALRLLEAAGLGASPEIMKELAMGDVPEDFGPFAQAWQAIRQDLNTPGMLGGLHRGLKWAMKGEGPSADEARQNLVALAWLLEVLGVDLFQKSGDTESAPEAPVEIAELAAERWEAKQSRDWARADELREAIAELGWQVLDRKDGYDLAPK